MSYKKRSRKRNFSADELAILQEAYDKHREILESKSNNNNINKKKHEAWKEITQSVNAVGFEWRGVDEIRKKWNNLCTMAKTTTGKRRIVGKLSSSRHISKVAANIYKDEPSFVGIEKSTCAYEVPVKISDSDDETIPRKTYCVISIPESETVNGLSTEREQLTECGKRVELTSDQIRNEYGSERTHQEAEIRTTNIEEESTSRRKRLMMEEEYQQLRHKTQLIKHNNALLEEEKLKLEIRLLKKRLGDSDNAANTNILQENITRYAEA